MKRLVCAVLALALSIPVFPQAVSKASPTPSTTPAIAPATAGHCAPEYYQNVSGVCVHRPTKAKESAAPTGATAQCRDGVYSFSQHRRGTCSHHGGVAKWL
jgi:hypothetical protein